MNTPTPTPRTDKLVFIEFGDGDEVVPSYLSRQLERELTAAREELAEWSILKGWGVTPEIINDFIKGQQTRIHHAQNIEEELTAVTEQREYWANLWADLARATVKDTAKLEREAVTVTEQLEEARKLAEKYRYLSCDSQEEADETLLPWETTNPNEL